MCGRGKFWTVPEIGILHELYPIGGVRAVRRLLPDRSSKSIRQQAERESVKGTRGRYKPD